MTRGRSFYPVTKLTTPEVGKWVTVNVNGNTHHEARILISPYTMRQFENLLSHLTDKLKPPFGAVWRLFTEGGSEIKDLDEIQGGHTYIASGRAKPAFHIRTGVRSGRGRRDGGREIRSHSAVGSLGGARSAGVGGYVPDAASDTNVKKKHSLTALAATAKPQPRPSRPAPRRGNVRQAYLKAGEQIEPDGHEWEGYLHSQQQTYYQPKSSAKRKQVTGKKNYAEDCPSDEDMGKMEGMRSH